MQSAKSCLTKIVLSQALAYAEPLEQATARHARAWKVGSSGCFHLAPKQLLIARKIDLYTRQANLQGTCPVLGALS